MKNSTPRKKCDFEPNMKYVKILLSASITFEREKSNSEKNKRCKQTKNIITLITFLLQEPCECSCVMKAGFNTANSNRLEETNFHLREKKFCAVSNFLILYEIVEATYTIIQAILRPSRTTYPF